MSIHVDPVSPCPEWCSVISDEHELGYRELDGALYVAHVGPVATRVNLLQEDVLGADGLRQPGSPALVLDGHADAPMSPSDARDLGLKLLEVADALERAPRRRQAPERLRGRPVIPRHLHDVLCGWRVASRDEYRPSVAWCAGCSCGVAFSPVRGAD